MNKVIPPELMSLRKSRLSMSPIEGPSMISPSIAFVSAASATLVFGAVARYSECLSLLRLAVVTFCLMILLRKYIDKGMKRAANAIS